MAGNVYHKWDGTTLTITSDSGTSSMNLKGATGPIGPRGPQGPAGVVVGSGGSVDLTGYATENYVDQQIANVEAGLIDMSKFYTKTEVDAKLSNLDLTEYYTKGQSDLRYLQDEDLVGLATEAFVTNKIAEAQLDGSGVDLTGMATKDELAAYRLTNNNTFENGIVATDGANTMNVKPTGIDCGTGAVEIAVTGEAHFTDIYSNGNLVATQEWVQQFFEGIVNGDEVSY